MKLTSSTNLTYRAAIRLALREELRRDERVFLIGEDIGDGGGVFKVTEELIAEFGPRRIIDTPISETAIVGAALGASITGLVPVAEIMFSDFLAVVMDQIANQIAKHTYLSGGRVRPGLVIRTATGGGLNFGPQHSQSLEAWFAHTPGIVVLVPGDSRDAKGLLKTAIRSRMPVMFFEHKALYQTSGPVPDSEELLPIGKCEIRREGKDLTLIGAGATLSTCVECAERLAKDGIDAEVINIRTLSPLDSATILESARKTGRILIVEEDVGFCGWGAEIAAQISEQAFSSLRAPVRRVSAPYSPVPYSPPLEKSFLPSADKAYIASKSLFN